MQILALSRRLPGTTADQLAALAADEAGLAHELVVQGIVRSIHMCPERPGSMLVLECADLDAARAALERLPMVRDGLITFDLSRMLPYTGYAALFHPSQRGPAE
jgi:muconolactone delta-isomerase